jgi:Cu+-exporting ATPase
MDIDMRQAAGRSDFEGHTFYFCSPGCKETFDSDPEAALKGEAEYDHAAGPSMHTA